MAVHVVAAAALLAASQIALPDWVRRPDAEAVQEAYPAVAAFMKIEGRAAISCSVADTGKTRNCQVIYESPKRLGFGAAALRLAADFQMRPLTVSGIAIDGGAVQIPLVFKMPPDDPPEPEAKTRKPSKTTVDLARQFFTAIGVFIEPKPDLKAAITDLELSAGAGVDAEVWASAAKAYDTAYRESWPAAVDLAAEHFASISSEHQLRVFLRFATSPQGQADKAAQYPNDLPDPVLADEVLIEKVRDRARAVFCAQVDCTSAPRAAQP